MVAVGEETELRSAAGVSVDARTVSSSAWHLVPGRPGSRSEGEESFAVTGIRRAGRNEFAAPLGKSANIE